MCKRFALKLLIRELLAAQWALPGGSEPLEDAVRVEVVLTGEDDGLYLTLLVWWVATLLIHLTGVLKPLVLAHDTFLEAFVAFRGGQGSR